MDFMIGVAGIGMIKQKARRVSETKRFYYSLFFILFYFLLFSQHDVIVAFKNGNSWVIIPSTRNKIFMATTKSCKT